MEEIKEKLRAFIQEKFEIDDDPDFTDDVHLFNEGFVDSFEGNGTLMDSSIAITYDLQSEKTIEEIAEVVENKLS